MLPTAPPNATMPRLDPCTTGSSGMKWTILAAGMMAFGFERVVAGWKQNLI
jgi:hypothetical protein